MPDAIFAHPRLAAIYDGVAPDRRDLDHYVAIVEEFGSRSALDIGCGTGALAVRLAARGVRVIGLDPAEASLDVGRRKPQGDDVHWIHGDVAALPDLTVDLAVMTGNVAQVFLDDESWAQTLAGASRAVHPDGLLVFETRNPSAQGWEAWTRHRSLRTTDTIEGRVESWVDLTDVDLPFVSFRWTYRFLDDGAELTSESTLRFRTMPELTTSLAVVGLVIDEVRDAPDRPGEEWVIIARPREPAHLQR